MIGSDWEENDGFFFSNSKALQSTNKFVINHLMPGNNGEIFSMSSRRNSFLSLLEVCGGGLKINSTKILDYRFIGKWANAYDLYY